MTTERRKHLRFKVQGNALAALRQTPTVAGRLINISEGGLSFRYVASRQRSKECSHLNLLVDKSGAHFKSLPFTSVWDSAMPDAFSCGSISIRQCGVAFGQMMEAERQDLKAFIRNHTSPDREDPVSNNIEEL